jgi:hypothetical protein
LRWRRIPGVHPRQLDQVLQGALHGQRVVHHDAGEALAPRWLGRDVGVGQELPGAQHGADAVLELVRHHAVEAAQPLLALAHPLGARRR